ncbi:LacI family DNA-binding transcriptional regulator [Lactiplantibacillus mudanjiangensis]|uniref:LacI family transcriptional regulator [Lactobacillus sp.] n=1 Tax=Lactiplantibacillus mudanjiangensis TaxID=1296538 RepID=A0A660E1B3_9LACO|nr:LacI family DNA-binding transcriptional regulator [Lactiplantibacillus mudanjiangensis]VDG21209.1 LacI family transcriptional regulator [Lactobacillus sp.] [Lactiplantibacillus mudanjiangensis]VDG22851.1 LacI family transcriptional regulator [Lactobacillus sp.] [Lactiplantibacillus mudanjiangensis]VDG26575.1 LacI family transcriptional regulator [Lactobacillus sp.] [Lactiplantibacillus mudanjiangensis]VDG31812.1 LacI family transcriptional regulator [Lactobacillus sp.] [Lactiplantibacillus m
MATIKDVAKLAKVSPSTASRAMHDNPAITQKTKARVWKAMQTLHYAPDFNAQSLANKRSNAIGVILPVDHHEIFTNPFFLKVLRGISEACYQAQAMVNLATGSSQAELLNSIDIMVTQGMIRRFIVLYSEKDDPILTKLRQLDAQYVMIGKPYQLVNETPYVDNDNILAGSDAAQFLVDHGHKNICFVYNDLKKMVQNDRMLGYQRVMMDNQLLINSFELPAQEYPGGRQLVIQYLTQHPEITAFITVDDMLGLRIQQVLKSSTMVADREASIIGFNNSVFSEAAHPALTSVEIFPRRLGHEAAKIAVGLQSDDHLSTKLIVPHQIIERHSVATV